MKVTSGALALLSCFTSVVLAASSWSFDDATLTVQGKGAGVGGGVKEKYTSPVRTAGDDN